MKQITLFIVAVFLAVTMVYGNGTKEDSGNTVIQTAENVPQMGLINSNPLSDVRVRRAIAYAIDMEAIIEGLLPQAVQADSLTPNNEWKTPGLEPYAYNPEKAKELLDEAGWDSSQELDLVYYYGDQLTVDFMLTIQAYLSEVGIKVVPRKLEGDLSLQLWVVPDDPIKGPSKVEWDLAYAGIAAISEYEYYNRFQTGSKTNSHTPGNAELDSLLEKVNATTNGDLQKQYFAEIQKFENTFLPIIPLYYQQLFVVESDRLDRNGAGYGNEQYCYDWKVHTWNIEPDASGRKIMKTNGGPVQFFEVPFVNPGQYMSQKVLFDRLIAADGSLQNFKGQLAEEFTVSDEGLTISFTMKDGITWHDGSPITADDVKFTWELAGKVPSLNVLFSGLLKKLDGYTSFVEGTKDEIEGIVVDNNTVTFNFDTVFPNALVALSQLPPLPEKHLGSVDPLLIQQSPYWQEPIGSGPFQIKDLRMNNYCVLVPYQNYHDGTANIDEIQLYPSAESDPNLVKNVKAGQVDYAWTKSLEDAKILSGIEGMNLHPYDMNYTRLLYVNKFPK